jgi:hypothetical protein
VDGGSVLGVGSDDRWCDDAAVLDVCPVSSQMISDTFCTGLPQVGETTGRAEPSHLPEASRRNFRRLSAIYVTSSLLTGFS